MHRVQIAAAPGAMDPESASPTVHQVSHGACPPAVAFRASLSLPVIGRWYVVLRIGREQRSPERLRGEGQHQWSRRLMVAAAVLAAPAAAFGVVSAIYLVKAWAGIDLMIGPSPLHALYADWLPR